MIRPLNDYVFVRRDKPPSVSPGGILLISEEKEWSTERQEPVSGVVVCVGPGRIGKKGHRESMWGITPGMHISFSPNGHWNQKVDGEELTVIRRDSIIGESS